MCVLDIELPFSSLHLPPQPEQRQPCAPPGQSQGCRKHNLFFQVCWRWERAAETRGELDKHRSFGCSSRPRVLWQPGLPSLVLLEVEVLESWEERGKEQ